MAKFEEIVGKVIIIVGTVCVIIFLASLIDGFVVSKLWNWIIVPLFDLRSLNWIQAVGICLVLRVMKGTMTNGRYQKDSNALYGVIGYMFIGAPIILFMGWIVKLFI